jgi:hypothetical protein
VTPVEMPGDSKDEASEKESSETEPSVVEPAAVKSSDNESSNAVSEHTTLKELEDPAVDAPETDASSSTDNTSSGATVATAPEETDAAQPEPSTMPPLEDEETTQLNNIRDEGQDSNTLETSAEEEPMKGEAVGPEETTALCSGEGNEDTADPVASTENSEEDAETSDLEALEKQMEDALNSPHQASSTLSEAAPRPLPLSSELLQATESLQQVTETPQSEPNYETPANETKAVEIGDDVTLKAETEALEQTTETPLPFVSPTTETKLVDEDDDVTNRAAIALAAVAAAATANHKSPAEAAVQARMSAQSLLQNNNAASSGTAEGAEKPRKFQTVRLTAVKTHLRQRALEAGSQLADKLAMGQNDAFLQHLLLLEYIRTLGDDDSPPNDVPVDDPAVAALACDRVWSLLKKIESTYESLLQLLPDARNKKEETDAPVDYETSVVVPDLLPLCTSHKGDSTVGFFRACTTTEDSKETKSDAFKISADSAPSQMPQQRRPSQSSTTTSASTVTESQTDTSSSASRSVFGGLFRRQGASSAPSNSSGRTASTNSITASSILNGFRKKKKGDESSFRSNTPDASQNDNLDFRQTIPTRPGEYVVQIDREMLGLTVENVLERTVVRTVLAGGPAKKAGARVGSLIVKVGNVETKNLTHFETIDELRQSQRPLVLILKQISENALRSAREEMGRLIRGSGFGNIYDGDKGDSEETSDGAHGGGASRPLIGADLRINAYTHLLRRRLAEAGAGAEVKNKKEEALAKLAEKLIWFETLFVVGLELESSRLFSLVAKNDPTASPRRDRHSPYHHTARDYEDAAKSVGKVLFDFTRKRLDPEKVQNAAKPPQPELAGGGRRRRGGAPPPPPAPGRGRGPRRRPAGAAGGQLVPHEKPLMQIGDVLQRTRTFLADTTSPPAALLRGELISFLCDVLDFDSDMELSEEDALTATAGVQAGPINDLGSAGSLLKLIVLNCPIMRSPGCEDASLNDDSVDPSVAEELRWRFGPKGVFSVGDLHRLHAGNRFLAVVHRLAASRSTSARITACSLGPVIWGHLDFPHQLQLRGVITRALHDVEVTVRKATATVLHEISELVFDQRCVPWLVLMCERAMTDPEPQLRSAAMTLTWHLAEHLPNAFQGDASQGSRYLRRLPDRSDSIFADVYLLQCKLLPVATRLAEDRSPSVRLAVAAQCDRLCDALGDHWASVVIDVLLGLLSDADERVRCEAVLCVPRLAEIVLLSTPPGEVAVSEVSILEALVPASIRLQKDTVPNVRVALAAAAGELLTLLVALQSRAHEATVHDSSGNASERSGADPEAGKQYKKQVDDRLIPLVQVLLNDPDPEVTSAALRAVTNASRTSMAATTSRHRMHSMASEDDSASVTSFQSHASREARQPVFLPVLSEVQVLRLLPTLSELAVSKQWRVRQSAVEIVPALLGCTKKQETRLEISKLCVRLMGDHVDAVRRTAAECLCMGGSSLGSHGGDASAEWIKNIVIPTIHQCAVHKNSKQRLLSLKMIESILLDGSFQMKHRSLPSPSDDSAGKELVSIALSLTQDRIANVRLNVGRVLHDALQVFENEELSFIKEVLSEQLNSEHERGGDRDVIFFAKRCAERAETLLDERQQDVSTSLL